MKKLYYLLVVIGVLIVAVVCSHKRDVTAPANQESLQAISHTLWGEGTLGDFVWADINCNGIQDTGERGIPNVTVKLYTCQDSLLRTIHTDSTGHYMFTDVLPGHYAIRFILPQGFTFSPMDQGANDSLDSDANDTTGFTQCITLDSSEVDLTWDAGLCVQQQEEGCLGDFVWEDLNCNGIQNMGEPGVESVMVKLYNCRDSSLVRTTLTNQTGHYLFAELAAGNYFIRFILPRGFEFSPKDQGSDDRIDSDADTLTGNTVCIELSAGECDSTWDAGLCERQQEESCLGDFVWNDLNCDGIQNEGEPGVESVMVKLYRCRDSSLVRTTFTNLRGRYLFGDLCPRAFTSCTLCCRKDSNLVRWIREETIA